MVMEFFINRTLGGKSMLTREDYIKNLKTRLDELHTGIIKIECKAKTVRKNVKAKLLARIKYLKEERDSALSKLQVLYNTSKDTWHDLKQGTENDIDSLKEALFKTIAQFKKIKVI